MKNHFRIITDDEGAASFQKHVALHFLALRGMDLDYFGADTGECTFNIDGIVFKVEEDPDDGYRSHLGPVLYADNDSSVFFRNPIAKVKILEYCDLEADLDISVHGELSYGYRLVDVEDGHIWLEFGTANYNDYYPYFMFRPAPKEKK